MGGSSGKVNLGVVGFDFNPNGGGVTVLGGRVGFSDRGFEAGPNLALGVDANGHGLHVDARADVTIGGRGLGVRTKAGATAGTENAQAHAYANGHGAGSYGGTSADARHAWERVQRAEAEVSHTEKAEAIDRENCRKAEIAKNKSANELNAAQANLRRAEQHEAKCGRDLADARQKLTDAKAELMDQDEISLFPEEKRGGEVQRRQTRVQTCQATVTAAEKKWKDAKVALSRAAVETPKCQEAATKCEEAHMQAMAALTKSRNLLQTAQKNLKQAVLDKDRALKQARGVSSGNQRARD